MAKILISTLPVTGHIQPALAAAKRLRDAGHEVAFAYPAEGTKAVEASFEVFQTTEDTFDYVPTTVRLWPARTRSDLHAIEKNIWLVLATWTASQIGPIRKIAESWRPELLISDCLHLAPLVVAGERSLPSMSLGVTPYRNLEQGSAPLRSGLAPARNPPQSVVYGASNAVISWWFRGVSKRLNSFLSTLSPILPAALAGKRVSIFGLCKELSTTYLQCSVPSLEDRSELLQANGVQFIGPLNSEFLCPQQHRPFADWNSPRAPLVFMSWGTMQASPPSEFLSVARHLLRSTKATVVVAPQANHRVEVTKQLAAEIASGRLELTADFKDFIPKLRQADVFVSNGGFGGVKAALTLGIPVVCTGVQDDKPDVCGRVQRSGAGIGLTWNISPERMFNAINQVLSNPRFRSRANIVGLELAVYDESSQLQQIAQRLLAGERAR